MLMFTIIRCILLPGLIIEDSEGSYLIIDSGIPSIARATSTASPSVEKATSEAKSCLGKKSSNIRRCFLTRFLISFNPSDHPKDARLKASSKSSVPPNHSEFLILLDARCSNLKDDFPSLALRRASSRSRKFLIKTNSLVNIRFNLVF